MSAVSGDAVLRLQVGATWDRPTALAEESNSDKPSSSLSSVSQLPVVHGNLAGNLAAGR